MASLGKFTALKSMAALAKPRGASRVDAAKEQVGQMIDGLLPDQELCLISFSRTARRQCDFTNNKRVLREALDRIQVEDVPSNIEDALRMAQALSALYPVNTDEKRWVDGVLARKKGLGF